MTQIDSSVMRLPLVPVAIVLISGLLTGKTTAAESVKNVAFPDKSMVRLSYIAIDNAETSVSILSSAGLGTRVSFNDDLGVEDSATIPRFDAYYRFNDRHRIEFSHFRMDRSGRKTISIDITLGEQTYSIDDTLVSEIQYQLTRIGYAYSFYRSPKVELSLSTGLYITDYDLSYAFSDGTSADSTGVTAPLPMFGFRGAYAINSNWSIHFLTESFFIDFDNVLKGVLLSAETSTEYKFDNGLRWVQVSQELVPIWT